MDLQSMDVAELRAARQRIVAQHLIVLQQASVRRQQLKSLTEGTPAFDSCLKTVKALIKAKDRLEHEFATAEQRLAELMIPATTEQIEAFVEKANGQHQGLKTAVAMPDLHLVDRVEKNGRGRRDKSRQHARSHEDNVRQKRVKGEKKQKKGRKSA